MSVIEPAAPDIIIKPKIDNAWTAEETNTARTLWADGQSGTMIGRALSRSRSAVMGKLMRMGLRRAGTRAPTAAPVRRQAAQRYNRGIRAAWAEATDLKPEAVPNPITIVDLEDCHCRWPVEGHGAAMLYCGGDAVECLPYCIRHARIAYQPARR